MRLSTIVVLASLAFVFGCASTSTFVPQWLSDPSHQVVYSYRGDGNVIVRVKAKVTESEFVAVTQRLKMVPLSEDKESANNLEALRWKIGPDRRWDPLPQLDATFLCHRGDWWETAKYEKGFLYYQWLQIASDRSSSE